MSIERTERLKKITKFVLKSTPAVALVIACTPQQTEVAVAPPTIVSVKTDDLATECRQVADEESVRNWIIERQSVGWIDYKDVVGVGLTFVVAEPREPNAVIDDFDVIFDIEPSTKIFFANIGDPGKTRDDVDSMIFELTQKLGKLPSPVEIDMALRKKGLEAVCVHNQGFDANWPGWVQEQKIKADQQNEDLILQDGFVLSPDMQVVWQGKVEPARFTIDGVEKLGIPVVNDSASGVMYKEEGSGKPLAVLEVDSDGNPILRPIVSYGRTLQVSKPQELAPGAYGESFQVSTEDFRNPQNDNLRYAVVLEYGHDEGNGERSFELVLDAEGNVSFLTAFKASDLLAGICQERSDQNRGEVQRIRVAILGSGDSPDPQVLKKSFGKLRSHEPIERLDPAFQISWAAVNGQVCMTAEADAEAEYVFGLPNLQP